jgi:hypothetical protein
MSACLVRLNAMRVLPSLSALLIALVVVGATAACTWRGGDDKVQTDIARQFDGYPLYWLGDRFERWDLDHVDVRPNGFSIFVYGKCTPHGEDEPSCSPPLQIQIQPLCAHLEAVARAPIWQHRRVRGAPVGTIDSAPVLFTSAAQVKVYRGEGSDRALPMRALRALRSINDIEPVIDASGPIPGPAPGVLAGTRACSS